MVDNTRNNSVFFTIQFLDDIFLDIYTVHPISPLPYPISKYIILSNLVFLRVT